MCILIYFSELCNKSKEESVILHAILILQAQIHWPSLFVEINAIPRCLDTQIRGYQPVHYGNPLLGQTKVTLNIFVRC